MSTSDKPTSRALPEMISETLSRFVDELIPEEMLLLSSNSNFKNTHFEDLNELAENERFEKIIEELQSIKRKEQREFAVEFIQERITQKLKVEKERKAAAAATAAPPASSATPTSIVMPKTPSSVASTHDVAAPTKSQTTISGITSTNPATAPPPSSSSAESRLSAAITSLTPPAELNPKTGSEITHARNIDVQQREEQRRSPRITSNFLDWKNVKEKFEGQRKDSREKDEFIVGNTLIKHEKNSNIAFSSNINPPDLTDLSKQIKFTINDINPPPHLEYAGGSVEQALKIYRDLYPVVPELVDLRLKKEIEAASKNGIEPAKIFLKNYEERFTQNPPESSRSRPSL